MIWVGDWVTQYSAGYWMVLEILPKYAEEDYCCQDKAWKKGDRLGDWVILKKGMTAKMKPGNGCEFVDARWCSPVPEETRQTIETVFAENPKAWQKFSKASTTPAPMVTSIWLCLTDEQTGLLREQLQELPERFTETQLREHAGACCSLLADPASATYVLYLFSYPWEMTEEYDLLHFGPELKQYGQ